MLALARVSGIALDTRLSGLTRGQRQALLEAGKTVNEMVNKKAPK